MSVPSLPRPPGHEPAINLPRIVLILLLVLLAAHGGREFLSAYDDFVLLSWTAFVPARLTLWLEPDRLDAVLREALGSGQGANLAEKAQLVRFLVAQDGGGWWTLLSYALLHGSWPHLLSNGLWLAAFGSPVARRLGAGRFLLLMALSAIAGALMHWWSRELDVLPLVGASAAISGATAAAVRFVFSDGARFGRLGDDATVRAIPAEPFGQLWRNPRALAFVAIWFATNLIFGAGVVPVLGEDSNIAWEAHVGGFLAGLALFPWLDRGSVRT